MICALECHQQRIGVDRSGWIRPVKEIACTAQRELCVRVSLCDIWCWCHGCLWHVTVCHYILLLTSCHCVSVCHYILLLTSCHCVSVCHYILLLTSCHCVSVCHYILLLTSCQCVTISFCWLLVTVCHYPFFYFWLLVTCVSTPLCMDLHCVSVFRSADFLSQCVRVSVFDVWCWCDTRTCFRPIILTAVIVVIGQILLSKFVFLQENGLYLALNNRLVCLSACLPLCPSVSLTACFSISLCFSCYLTLLPTFACFSHLYFFHL